jgi:threonine/homoserine/homoserine lactone efflux protein
MAFPFLLRGFFIGLAIAAPVGPIGLLCIRRTLAAGRTAGLVTGLGAATADAVYGGVAAFGLSLLTQFLIDQQAWLRLVGGGFLCFLGLRTFLARPSSEPLAARSAGLLGAYASTFFLTLTNPVTILAFMGIFAGLGAVNPGEPAVQAWVLVLGVFLGSAAWWLALSVGVSVLQGHLAPLHLRWLNRLAGGVLFVFGLLAIFFPQ